MQSEMEGASIDKNSIHVGLETVIQEHNLLNATIKTENEELTNRAALKPKYSHRKNTQHLLKKIKEDGIGRGVSSHLTTKEHSSRQIGLLTEATFADTGANRQTNS